MPFFVVRDLDIATMAKLITKQGVEWFFRVLPCDDKVHTVGGFDFDHVSAERNRSLLLMQACLRPIKEG